MENPKKLQPDRRKTKENTNLEPIAEKGQDQAYHEPDTLERSIEKMADEEETMEKTQSLMRRTQTTKAWATITAPTTRTKTGAEAETNGDTRAREEQGKEDYKNPQKDIVEQNGRNDDADRSSKLPAKRRTKNSRERRSATIRPTEASWRTENDNAEERNQLKQIKHAIHDLEPRRRKKRLDRSKTSEESTRREKT